MTESDWYIENYSKTELSNGLFEVRFDLNGEPQCWTGMDKYDCESLAIFSAYVIEQQEFAERVQKEMANIIRDDIDVGEMND